MVSPEEKKMLAGKIYDCSEPELSSKQKELNLLNEEFNRMSAFDPKRKEILAKFAPNIHPRCYFRGPVYFDYGCNIYMGAGTYANYNLTILDVCPVHIGENCHIGSGVSILTPLHPLIASEREVYLGQFGKMTDKEYGKPVTIGNRVWLASNVTVLPGVTIGDDTVIGAGSVVNKDIPSGVFACGNPCAIKRRIGPEDSLDNQPELF